MAATADEASDSRGPPERDAVHGGHADVEARLVEQILHRHDEPVGQEQHVEQQRPGGGDAQHAEQGAARLADETAPGEAEGRHRRTSVSAPARSSGHDAATLASSPIGTASPTERHATDGVMRTKTSPVS